MPNDKLSVYLDRPAHTPEAQDSCAPGFIWQGSGNSNTTFQRKRNLSTGVELSLKAIMRQGPDIRSTFVDGDGLVHIEVPTGTQQLPSPNPNRAAWNFTYSYDVALNPSNPDLQNFDVQLWIDLDPSKQTRYLKLTLDTGGTINSVPCSEPDLNGYVWKSGTTVVIGDDEGTSKVTQNSQNYAFYIAAIGDTNTAAPGVQPYAFGPAQFVVVMSIKPKGYFGDDSSKTTTLHVVFDVVNSPTQTP
jgi:hypothetical protein